MAKHFKDNSDWASLPVLTEIVGEVPPGIPLLTEEAASKQAPALEGDLPRISAEEIAARLAPQLETQLRAQLSAQFEAMWQETWRQTRARLPDLIRTQLASPTDTGLGGDKEPALDIIAPRTAPTGTRKAHKASATKPTVKDPKNKETKN